MSDHFNGSVDKLLDHRDLRHHCNPFQLNEDRLRHSSTGLVHCVMIRQTTTNRLTHYVSKKYQFSCQCPPKEEGVDSETKLVLVATKDLGHSYTIRSMDSDNPKSNGVKVGSIARVQMNMYSITYVLKNLEGASMAYFVYHVPSPIKVMRDTPPRFAEIALYQPLVFENDDDDHLLPIMKKHKKASTYFDKVCMESISKYHNLGGGINPDDPTIRVFRSLQPYISPATGRATLNFNGRGRYASPKNMQMTMSHPNPASAVAKRTGIPSSNDSSQSSTMNMQMCKWDTDTYHIDFDPPSMTFLYAFAFGLAQMDL